MGDLDVLESSNQKVLKKLIRRTPEVECCMWNFLMVSHRVVVHVDSLSKFVLTLITFEEIHEPECSRTDQSEG